VRWNDNCPTAIASNYFTVTPVSKTERLVKKKQLRRAVQQSHIVKILLQPLWWCCGKCVIHHEWDVREEHHHTYMWREQAIIELSWHVNTIVACCQSAKLCAHAVWISDRNKMVL